MVPLLRRAHARRSARAIQDSEYLRASVGSVLAQGIAETVMERPEDPIAYLAEYLLKSVADEKADKKAEDTDNANDETSTAETDEDRGS